MKKTPHTHFLALWQRLRTAAAVSMILTVPAHPAVAQALPAQTPSSPTTTLELFTSQGCSSCPAADALFKSFATRNNLVALSYNVDYWDYLGWKDTLAKPQFSERQRSYASTRKDGAVYTPQLIVNGLAHAVGSRKLAIAEAITKTETQLAGQHVPLRVDMSDQSISIEIGARQSNDKVMATVWMASVRPRVTMHIKRGENRGKTITYHNVVRDLSAVGMWSGESTTIKLRSRNFLQKPGIRCAVLVQTDKGAILAAAWVPAPVQATGKQ